MKCRYVAEIPEINDNQNGCCNANPENEVHYTRTTLFCFLMERFFMRHDVWHTGQPRAISFPMMILG